MTEEREALLRGRGSLTADEVAEVWAALDESRWALSALWNGLDRKLTHACEIYEADSRRHADTSAKLRAERAMTIMHLLKGVSFAHGRKVMTALRRFG